jgi:SOS-response transcriptional repressor LexA/DNA-binding MarR family transcriptional regulator
MASEKKGLASLEEIAERSAPVRRWVNERSLPFLLNHLMAFIRDYQNKHNGVTPSVHTIANELEVTDQQVRFYINKLEQDGALHRYGQNPIRIMLKDSPPPIEVTRRLLEALKPVGKLDGTAKERYDAVDAKRQNLGRFIGMTQLVEGRPPTLRECMAYAEIDSPGWVTAQIGILRNRGLIHPEKTELTAEGRMTYGLEHIKQEELKMEQKIATGRRLTIQEVQKIGQAKLKQQLAERREREGAAALEYIKDHITKFGKSPSRDQIATGIGKSTTSKVPNALGNLIYPTLKYLTAKGLIRRPNPKSHQIEVIGWKPPASRKEEMEVKKPIIIPARPRKTGHGRVNPVGAMVKMLVALHKDIESYGYAKGADEYRSVLGYTQSGVASVTRRLVDNGLITKGTSFSSIRLTPMGAAIVHTELGLSKDEIAAEPVEDVQLDPEALSQAKEQANLRVDEVHRLRNAWDTAAHPPQTAPWASAPYPPMTNRVPRLDPSYLRQFETADLMLELQERGYVVRRAG